MIISIDGRLVAPEDATISVLDRGLLYGDGLFEVLRTWSGVAVDLDAHLDRLAASAGALTLRLPELEQLAAWTRAAIAAAATPPDVRVRIVVTRGPGGIRERLASLSGGRTIIIVEPLPPPAPAGGISLALVDSPIARDEAAHKTLSYLENLLARERAVAAGADDAIRSDSLGMLVECATANLFLVVAGTVLTPDVSYGALPGIVRGRVLAACDRLGIRAVVRGVSLKDLDEVDEIFVTSSLRGVVPVTRLGRTPLPAGPVTRRLAADHIAEMSALAAQLRDRVTL